MAAGRAVGRPPTRTALLRRHPTAVDAHVGAPRLASRRDGELVDVGPQVADAVQAGRRRVGDDGDVGVLEPLPGRPGRVELQPGGSELEMVGLGRPPDSVDTVRHPLEEPRLDEPRQRPPGDAGRAGLLEGDQAPLPFGDVSNADERA